MIEGPIPEGLTFDDVLLLPGKEILRFAHPYRYAHLPFANHRAEYSLSSPPQWIP